MKISLTELGGKEKDFATDNRYDLDFSEEWSLFKQGLLYWSEAILRIPIFCYQLKALQVKTVSIGLFKPDLNQKSST